MQPKTTAGATPLRESTWRGRGQGEGGTGGEGGEEQRRLRAPRIKATGGAQPVVGSVKSTSLYIHACMHTYIQQVAGSCTARRRHPVL